jgi:hypothetical protein
MMARLRVVSFVSLVAAAIAGLHTAGSGALRGPSSLATFPTWLEGRDPLIAGFALLRLGALALGWYVLTVALLGTAGRMLRAGRLLTALDAITLPSIRRLLNAGAGLAVVVTTSVPAGTAWAGPSSSRPPVPTLSRPRSVATVVASDVPPVMHWLGQQGPLGAGGPTSATGATSAAGGTSPAGPTPAAGAASGSGSPAPSDSPAHPLTAPDAAAPSAAAPGSLPPGASGAPGWTGAARPLGPGVRPLGPEFGHTSPEMGAGSGASGGTGADIAMWTVQPGDNFWHIAEATLAAAWGRPVTDVEIAPYWLLLIKANRDRLAVPSEPSFIYPGQVFVLPPAPPLPASGRQS